VTYGAEITMRIEPVILSVIGMLLLFGAVIVAFQDALPLGAKIFGFVLPAIIIYSAFQIDRLQRKNKKQ
jgi:hypothetical protein